MWWHKAIRARLRPFKHYLVKYRRFYFVGILALVVVDVLEVVPPLILKDGVDNLTAGTSTSSSLMLLAMFYILIALVQGAMRFLWRMYVIRTSMRAGDDMRRHFFHHLTCLALSFFKRKRVGELVSLATNDIQSVRFVLGPTVLIFLDAVFHFCTNIPMIGLVFINFYTECQTILIKFVL